MGLRPHFLCAFEHFMKVIAAGDSTSILYALFFVLYK
jgi:hypothetical protein